MIAALLPPRGGNPDEPAQEKWVESVRLGEAEYARKNYAAALAAYDANRAIKVNPNRGAPYLARGLICAFRGEYAGALTNYALAEKHKLDGGYEALYYNWACAYGLAAKARAATEAMETPGMPGVFHCCCDSFA